MLFRSEDGLQQFEALLALTNLALFSEETAKLMIKGNGLSTIEMLQLSNNAMIQRAATELICNLVIYDEPAEKLFGHEVTNGKYWRQYHG